MNEKPLLETTSRHSAAQTSALCTFFEENPEVVCGYKKTSKCKDAVKAKWRSITPHLNSLGLSKDHKAWAKYLCNLKAKLKKKRVKWKQNSDGSGPVIANASDFTEIELRLFQILRKQRSNSHQSHDSRNSDVEFEIVKNDDIYDSNGLDDDNTSIKYTDDRDDATSSNETNGIYIKLPNGTPLEPQLFMKTSEYCDEFDSFGKNVAQQLRTLPLGVALETEEVIISLLRKQRLRALNDV